MKYIKKSLAFVAIILTLFALCACSPSLLELDGGYSASFVGHMVQIGEDYAALTDVYPGENNLELYSDGTGTITFSGFEEPLTWKKNGSEFTITFQNEPSVGTLHEGILVVDIEGALVTYVAENATTPEIPTTQAPDYNSDPTTAYGTYHGLSISYDGEAMDITEYYKGECSITLNSEGMGTLVLGGSALTIAWEAEEDFLTIADENGINSYGIIENGVLVLDYMDSGIQLAFAKEGYAP